MSLFTVTHDWLILKCPLEKISTKTKVFKFNGPFLERTVLMEKITIFLFCFFSYFSLIFKSSDKKITFDITMPATLRRKMF